MAAFPEKYRALNQNVFASGNYKIVPIRYEDRLKIMKWRNDQIIYLRQLKPLTEAEQNDYFNSVVSHLFENDMPKQILVSFLEYNKLIGYGGLVHIDWENLNAEISFLLDTEINSEYNYKKLSVIFFQLIKRLAKSINLHKIYTYGYDIEEFRFFPLIYNEFSIDAILKKHIKIGSKLYDVRIYSKLI
jgi:RimJ/RimL family protein N-acetyltransferase